ncbi:hypothetical protein BK146_27990 [Paenibacillus sp. FSL R7-0333]|nr:hypothetical protein BK146_27990 [Paenibacillus sp. FSL R7-0333]
MRRNELDVAELGYGCDKRRWIAGHADYRSAISANGTIPKAMRTEGRLINQFRLILRSIQPFKVLSVRTGKIISLFHKIRAAESAKSPHKVGL